MSDYYSVLVCIRKDRTEVYINGLPLSEKTDKVLITTKRTDVESARSQLREADYAITEAHDELQKHLKR